MKTNPPFPSLSTLLSLVSMLFISTIYAQNPTIRVFEDWSDTSGTQNDFQRTVVRSKAIGGTTYYYVCGATLNSSGDYDILTRKLDASGNELWTQTYSGSGNGDDFGADIQIDNVGNVYVCGLYYKDATDSTNAIILKYNAAGTYKWAYTYNGTGSRNDVFATMQVSANAVIAGGTTWKNSTNKYDFLMARLDSNGTQIWLNSWDYLNLNDAAVNVYNNGSKIYIAGGAQSATTTYKYAALNVRASDGAVLGNTVTGGTAFGIDQVTDLKVDANQNIYITGSALDMSAMYDIRTIKLDTALNILWSHSYDGGTGANDFGSGVTIDQSGNVIVCGTSQTSSNGTNYVVLKYNSSGTLLWDETYNGTANGNDSATAVVVHPTDTNKIYVTGYSFNGSTKDYYTLKYDAAGTRKWEIGYNNIYNGDDRAFAITLDTTGNVIVTGQNKWNDSTYVYTTVKYVEKNTLLPQDTISTGSSYFVFTENRNQLIGTDTAAHPEIRFYTITGGPQLFFADTSITFALSKMDTATVSPSDSLCRVDLKFQNSNTDQRIHAMEARTDYYNFFLAAIPEGRSRVQNHNKLISFNVWDNVDIIYGSNLSGLKTYFICKPGGGGNPVTSIDLKFEGADSVTVSGSGELIVYTRFGNIIYPKASAWQLDANGNFTSLGWQPTYNEVAPNEIIFSNLGSFSTALPLVIAMDWGNIQPTNIQNLEWSTYYGGTGNDVFMDSKTDAASNMYVTGSTTNGSFPVTNAYQQNYAGTQDVFAGKFDSQGQRIWMTFFGGGNTEQGTGIAVDINGLVYVTGWTLSGNFPPVPNSNTSSYFQNILGSPNATDAFIFRLSNSGQNCDWSTYYGTTGMDQANAIECDPSGNIFIVGYTESNTFPTQFLSGAYNQAFAGPFGSDRDAFIVKFSASNLDNVWATFYGGTNAVTETANDIAIDANGNITIVGTTESATMPTLNSSGAYFDNSIGGLSDGFIVHFNSSCARVWATYYGGTNGTNGYDKANAVAVNSNGDIFVTGLTYNSDFPTQQLSGAYWQPTKGTGTDAYLLKFSGTNFACQWATFYGGNGADEGNDLCVDAYGNLYISGKAGNGFPFPTILPTGTYTQSWQGGSNGDAFISAFYNGSLVNVWGSYVGGTADDLGNTVCVDLNGQLFLLGSTQSMVNFPLDNGSGVPFYQPTFAGGSTDGYISRFSLSPVLGVGEPTFESGTLFLYPNPANDRLFVNYTGQDGEILKFTVCNMLGQVVHTINTGKVYGESSFVLDLTGISSGVYFLTAECGGQIISKKFIKQ